MQISRRCWVRQFFEAIIWRPNALCLDRQYSRILIRGGGLCLQDLCSLPPQLPGSEEWNEFSICVSFLWRQALLLISYCTVSDDAQEGDLRVPPQTNKRFLTVNSWNLLFKYHVYQMRSTARLLLFLFLILLFKISLKPVTERGYKTELNASATVVRPGFTVVLRSQLDSENG